MAHILKFIKELNGPSLNRGWLFVILVAVFIPHVISSYEVVHRSIGPDLLFRTIGSRLQEAQMPPYEYKWKTGDPVQWLNPYGDKRTGVNGVVSTPFVLWLLQPLARLDYCTVRIIWVYVQEILMALTLWFSCLIFKERLSQLIFILLSAFFFVYDRNWLLHLYNGQMYVVYAFFFAVAAYVVLSYRSGMVVIIIFPLVSIIRPFFIPAIIPFLTIKKQALIFLASSIAITLIVAAAATNFSEWKQYSHAMKLYAKEQVGQLTADTASRRLYKDADACTINADGKFASFGGGCLYSLQHYLFLAGVPVTDVVVFQVILFSILILVLIAARKKDWLKDLPKQLVLSFLFYQLCELLTPAARNPYSMVQWLPVVALLNAFGDKKVWWLVIAGLCLNHDLPFHFKYEREIGELLLFAATVVFLNEKKYNPNNTALST